MSGVCKRLQRYHNNLHMYTSTLPYEQKYLRAQLFICFMYMTTPDQQTQ